MRHARNRRAIQAPLPATVLWAPGSAQAPTATLRRAPRPPAAHLLLGARKLTYLTNFMSPSSLISRLRLLLAADTFITPLSSSLDLAQRQAGGRPKGQAGGRGEVRQQGRGPCWRRAPPARLRCCAPHAPQHPTTPSTQQQRPPRPPPVHLGRALALLVLVSQQVGLEAAQVAAVPRLLLLLRVWQRQAQRQAGGRAQWAGARWAGQGRRRGACAAGGAQAAEPCVRLAAAAALGSLPAPQGSLATPPAPAPAPPPAAAPCRRRPRSTAPRPAGGPWSAPHSGPLCSPAPA
jgi:hypothetical protein